MTHHQRVMIKEHLEHGRTDAAFKVLMDVIDQQQKEIDKLKELNCWEGPVV